MKVCEKSQDFAASFIIFINWNAHGDIVQLDAQKSFYTRSHYIMWVGLTLWSVSVYIIYWYNIQFHGLIGK